MAYAVLQSPNDVSSPGDPNAHECYTQAGAMPIISFYDRTALMAALDAFWWSIIGAVLLLVLLLAGYGRWRTAKKPTETPKNIIGPYRIEQTLGQGATSIVYLGRDLQSDQTVALKIYSPAQMPGLDSLAGAQQRFLQGAAIASQLDHPCIVRIHGQGESAGVVYVAMELLQGKPLELYANPTPDTPLLSVPQVILIVAQVAMALDYAHKNQVIHRDIKPANILFDATSNQVKILDFGIAQSMQDDGTNAGKSRRVSGTPYYMSPEQWLGQEMDGRSDLFSLGVVFFQLLTGTLPFPAQQMASLLRQVVRKPPIDLLSLRPTLPPCLAAVIEKMLQKNPELRYQSGREMTKELMLCVKTHIRATKRAADPTSRPVGSTDDPLTQRQTAP